MACVACDLVDERRNGFIELGHVEVAGHGFAEIVLLGEFASVPWPASIEMTGLVGELRCDASGRGLTVDQVDITMNAWDEDGEEEHFHWLRRSKNLARSKTVHRGGQRFTC